MEIFVISQIFVICVLIQSVSGSKRVTETWKNTTEGINFKIKRSLFTKISERKFKITENVNIIQQTYQSTPTNCGKACQNVEPCLGFLFRRNMQQLNCLLVDHSVNIMDMEDDEGSDYYEIQVIYLTIDNVRI